MFISTTTLTSSPSDLTAVGQKQEACSSIGLLARQSPSDRPLTTPSSTTLSMAIRQPNWSEADTLFEKNRMVQNLLIIRYDISWNHLPEDAHHEVTHPDAWRAVGTLGYLASGSCHGIF